MNIKFCMVQLYSENQGSSAFQTMRATLTISIMPAGH